MVSRLHAFLESGAIGSVVLGISQSRVLEILGLPSLWHGRERFGPNESDVWRYGVLQLNFDKDQVSSIILHCQPSELDFGSTDVAYSEFFEDGGLGETTTQDEFVTYLKHHGFNFECGEDQTRRRSIRISLGVIASFVQLSDVARSISERHRVGSAAPVLVSVEVETPNGQNRWNLWTRDELHPPKH